MNSLASFNSTQETAVILKNNALPERSRKALTGFGFAQLARKLLNHILLKITRSLRKPKGIQETAILLKITRSLSVVEGRLCCILI
jgi:hypothetical protein